MPHAHILETATAVLGGRLHDLGTLSLATDESVISLLGLIGDARRAIDALGAEVAGEAARRSELHDTSLARRLGEVSAATLVARLTSIAPGKRPIGASQALPRSPRSASRVKCCHPVTRRRLTHSRLLCCHRVRHAPSAKHWMP